MKKNEWLKMKKSSFVEGTIIATISIVVTKILGMFYVIPFYAIIGVQGSALYAYAFMFYNIFLDISTAGLPIAVSKIINEYNTLGMMDAKNRAYHLAKKIMGFLAVSIFIIMIVFAPALSQTLIGDLQGGNTPQDVAFVIRCVAFAILIVPFLSVEKGYLQGHKIINISSGSQVIEQIVRIAILLIGSYLIINVFNGSVTLAVGLSVFGAFVAGFVAYAFVRYQVAKHQKELNNDNNYGLDNITNKEITKKIFSYAIPFIIINIVNSLYNFTDMTLILRTMNYLKLSANDVEFVTSAVITWAPKINMIIASIAMGMTTSLIPTMVSAYTLKNWDEVNSKFNQALQILLFLSIPMTVGISLLSQSIWSAFYGYNISGGYIVALSIFNGLCNNIFMVTSIALQGLNKFKTVYITTITGLVCNAALDVPLMLLYNKIGIPPYLGAVSASIIGYIISITITLTSLKRDCKLKYKDTFKELGRILVPTILMIGVVVLLKAVIPTDYTSRLSCIILILITSLSGAIVYLLVAFKMGIVSKIFGHEYIKRLIKKLTFGKISI